MLCYFPWIRYKFRPRSMLQSFTMTEDSKRKLGIVVVGVGIAGRVRIRDISQTSTDEESPWTLIGYVSRRELDIEGASQLSEDEALSRSDVDAVLVCTEPAAHQDLIRKALTHGKHVLVEFPVATSLACTKQLFSLASEKGLVLHEENIALLTQSFTDMREAVKTANCPILKAELSLTGSYNGWVEDFEKLGGPFCVNVSMVQSLYELFGSDLSTTSGQLVKDDEGFTATATLTTSKCRDLTLRVRRTKEKSRRHKTMRIELSDGRIIEDSPEKQAPSSTGPAPVSKKVGLFQQDFLMFVSEVKKERDYSADTDRVLHCMAVVEQIHSHMGLNTAAEAPS